MYWIGTRGWSYSHWKGRWYPDDLPPRSRLEYYCRHFNSVEINATFYRLQRPETFARWTTAAPDEFRFAFKASRYLTHVKRLSDVGEGLAKLLETTVPLGRKRGPMLVQLPPRFPPYPDRLDTLLASCPADLLVAVEFRDPAWFVSVRRHGAAGRFAGRYGTDLLAPLAAKLAAAGKEVFCYFNNDAQAAAPADARELAELLAG